jgi:hypothetical protein
MASLPIFANKQAKTGPLSYDGWVLAIAFGKLIDKRNVSNKYRTHPVTCVIFDAVLLA